MTDTTTPTDRGFAEVTDMYGEITDAITRKIQTLEHPPTGATRLLTGMPRRLYDLIIETRIDTCRDIQDIVDDIYAAHDSSDYLEHGRTDR